MPIGVITGAEDRIVAPALAERYAPVARRHGDDVTAITVPGAAHFEVIAPGSTAWPVVERVAASMVGLGSKR